MKKIIKSGPMKLVSNRKALSSGFITNTSITRTAAVPYLFIHGDGFMGLLQGDRSRTCSSPLL
jgi:hypothetical protein